MATKKPKRPTLARLKERSPMHKRLWSMGAALLALAVGLAAGEASAFALSLGFCASLGALPLCHNRKGQS